MPGLWPTSRLFMSQAFPSGNPKKIKVFEKSKLTQGFLAVFGKAESSHIRRFKINLKKRKIRQF